MKIIAVGDPHFKIDNIEEINLFTERFYALIEKEKPDLIVILGDVLHTHERLHTIPLNKAHEFIKKTKSYAKTIVLVGNHDMCNNQQFLTTNHWMNGMKEWENVVIVDTVYKETQNEFTFVFVPYVPPSRFEEALNTIEDWKEADCIFAHQEFFGCKMGAIISNEGDKWSKKYPPIVSGHIHSKQTISNVYYCGSAMQNAFGESEENIIPIFIFEKDKPYLLKEVDLELPRKKIIRTDIENINELKLPETSDDIKLTVSGNYEEFKAFKKTKKYKDLVKSGKKVVFKHKKSEIKEKKQVLEKVEDTNFHNVLEYLVLQKKNSLLYSFYQNIVFNKESDEVLIL